MAKHRNNSISFGLFHPDLNVLRLNDNDWYPFMTMIMIKCKRRSTRLCELQYGPAPIKCLIRKSDSKPIFQCQVEPQWIVSIDPTDCSWQYCSWQCHGQQLANVTTVSIIMKEVLNRHMDHKQPMHQLKISQKICILGNVITRTEIQRKCDFSYIVDFSSDSKSCDSSQNGFGN